MTTRESRTTTVLVAGLIAIVGCSGGDEKSASDTSATTAAPSTTGATTTSVAATTSVATTIEVTTTTGAPSTVAETTTSTTSTTSTTTSTTLAPTTTLDPMELARQQYYVISGESNNAKTFVENAYPNLGYRQAPAYCAAMAPIDEKFANDLKAAVWPEEVQDEIDALAAVDAEIAGIYYQCAGAPGTQSAQEANFAALEDAGNRAGGAASALRLALGLPIDRGT